MQHCDNKLLVDNLHNMPNLTVNTFRSYILQGTIQYLNNNSLQDKDYIESDFPMSMIQGNMVLD